MALRAVFFDVGETLVDETGMWERTADACSLPRFTFMSLLGALVARGEPHRHVYQLLGVESPDPEGFRPQELYPDALPCLRALRRQGLRVGAAGNMRAVHEDVLRGEVDVLGSSERWGVEKPAAGFFERISAEAGCPPAEIAYVGDRVDNDVVPARRAGMLAIHIRRGPWGYLHDATAADRRIDSLAELPEALTGV